MSSDIATAYDAIIKRKQDSGEIKCERKITLPLFISLSFLRRVKIMSACLYSYSNCRWQNLYETRL